MSIVKRQRGGQPNNTNALKHGYYASKLPQAVSQELREHKFTGLEEEKEVIRFFLARVLQLGAESDDLQENLEFLRVVSLAISTLTRIIRTEKYAGFLEQAGINEELAQKIAELSARYKQDRQSKSDPSNNDLGIRSDSFFAEPETFENEPDVHPLDQPAPSADRSDSTSTTSPYAPQNHPTGIRSDSFSCQPTPSNPVEAHGVRPLEPSRPFDGIPPQHTTASKPPYDPYGLIQASKHPTRPKFFQPNNTHDRF